MLFLCFQKLLGRLQPTYDTLGLLDPSTLIVRHAMCASFARFPDENISPYTKEIRALSYYVYEGDKHKLYKQRLLKG